jgi:hypothetical protein
MSITSQISPEWERHITRKEKKEHIISLENEVKILAKRIRTRKTENIIIAIGVLNERIDEVRDELDIDGDRKAYTEKVEKMISAMEEE